MLIDGSVVECVMKVDVVSYLKVQFHSTCRSNILTCNMKISSATTEAKLCGMKARVLQNQLTCVLNTDEARIGPDAPLLHTGPPVQRPLERGHFSTTASGDAPH